MKALIFLALCVAYSMGDKVCVTYNDPDAIVIICTDDSGQETVTTIIKD